MSTEDHIDWTKWNDADFQQYLDENSQALQIPPEIYRRILGKAVEQTRQDIPQIETAFGVDDIDTIQTISHRWKGDYDNLRMTSLAQAARTVNTEAKGGRDKEVMTSGYEQFKALFNDMAQKLGS